MNNPGYTEPTQTELLPTRSGDISPPDIILEVESDRLEKPTSIGPGTWRQDRRRGRPPHHRAISPHGDSISQFVATYDSSLVELSSLWSDIALEDDEQRVIEALNVIEPDVSVGLHLFESTPRSTPETNLRGQLPLK